MARSKTKSQAENAQRSIADKSVQEILTILHKWGIHTLGQFAGLDKEDLNARLGPEAVRLWERANGKSKRLLKLVQPPESFGESFEFEHKVETIEPLLFMLRRFLQQLALRLSAIYLVANKLTLRITFADPPSDGFAVANKKGASATPVRLGPRTYERCFEIPQPTNDVDLLFRMLHTHLENFKSEQPIIAISLEAQPIKPARQQFGLFETAVRNPNQLYETLARLTALLGTDRVGTPVLEETYRPDAFRMEPFVWKLNDDHPHWLAAASPPLPLSSWERRTRSASEGEGVGLGEGRVRAALCSALSRIALRRFRPNVSAAVLLSKEKPAHIRSARIEAEVSAHKGPYANSGNWWDEARWSRIEWDVQLENGVVARCHQSPPSLSSGVASENGWAIDGIYD